jgi:uncharacterized protein (TIGR02646 family)
MRTACPNFLISNWERWGNSFKEKRAQNPSCEFGWPVLNKKRINHYLLPVLKSLTQSHCSYCDGYPLFKSDETIDHFGPKSNPMFYSEVCKWENLYVACNRCQRSKKEQYDRKLLRPDEEAYSFFNFFTYDYLSHKMGINPEASLEDQERAKVTIMIFDFNEPSLLIDRRNAFLLYKGITTSNNNEYTLDDFNYRFMLEP